MFNLNKIFVSDASKRPNLLWSESRSFFLPDELVLLLKEHDHLTHDNKLVIPSDEIPLAIEYIKELRLRGAYCKTRPISSKLPFNSQLIPPWVRTIYARLLGRISRKKVLSSELFPQWPVDLSVDFIEDLGTPSAKSRKPYISLTHDIDSLEGLRNLVKYFLPIEEAAGFHSTNFIVPCGWKLDKGLIDEIIARGHEIGIHGYNHGTLTPFLSKPEQELRLKLGLQQFEGIGINGYRAPALIRTQSLLESVSDIFDYDSSIPTSGGAFPELGGGCATARPFKIAGISEIPLSMPRDGSLLFLGYSQDEILTIWKECFSYIAASNGVIVLLTHCENRYSGNAMMLDIYKRFIAYCKDNSQVEGKLLREIKQ